MKPWRDRRWLLGAAQEIGCGFLTILVITIPLWVLTVATRGPGFALTAMALMMVALVGLSLAGRWFRRW